MKTVKDVYEEYKEWPHSYLSICVNDCGKLSFVKSVGFCTLEQVCTREQYEQYKAEQENKNMKSAWYDYGNHTAFDGLSPSYGEVVYFIGDTGFCLMPDSKPLDINPQTTSVVGFVQWKLGGGKTPIVKLVDVKGDEFVTACRVNLIRPLDHDKHTVKVAPVDWLVGSSIDCEFTDTTDLWSIESLVDIDDSFRPFINSDSDCFKYCRPRMNHEHVLTEKQVKVIPNCFIVEVCFVPQINKYIVEFTGLKDGYKFGYEANI